MSAGVYRGVYPAMDKTIQASSDFRSDRPKNRQRHEREPPRGADNSKEGKKE